TELWKEMRAKYTYHEMYYRAWVGSLSPDENKIFWLFAAGHEFKVWCMQRFLVELKEIMSSVSKA
ncbi:hypothetical protein LCGC14_1793670, partial [marine sediment metagenome]